MAYGGPQGHWHGPGGGRGGYQGGGGRGGGAYGGPYGAPYGGRGGGYNGYGGPGGGPDLRLPPGWEDCPEFGQPIQVDAKTQFRVIPSKVPLGPHYDYLIRNPNKRYTLTMAIDKIEQRYQQPVLMVLDLTNSRRYYDFYREIPQERGIMYCKVPCRGRGEVPEPKAVNEAVFEIQRCIMNTQEQQGLVLMHCTHGFNRTGYVAVCALIRLFGDRGMSVDRSIRRFAEARQPGIYKDQYINELFKYHHEKRSERIVTPRVPEWKGVGEEDDDEEGPPPPASPPKPLSHEDIEDIGEPINPEEETWIKGMVYECITGRQPPGEGHGRLHFPGSQPVSLELSRMELLERQRYKVSWKADGTRYLLLIMNQGCYLINRSYKIVRLQMRFPTAAKEGTKEYPVGRPHHMTILDGEMVVDEDNGKQVRRYLAYDLAFLREHNLVSHPWEERFDLLEREVIGPRNKEKHYIGGTLRQQFKSPPLRYDYGAEPFSVRRKDFWPLCAADKVINMIEKLSHKSDGLILQSCESHYTANTDNALLKFKFAHENSVDFKLTVSYKPGDPKPNFTLWLLNAKGHRNRNGPPPLIHIDTPVIFPEGVDGRHFDQKLIECNWLPDDNCWGYMRPRRDKETPNATHVYDNVVKSIRENIQVPELLEYLNAVFWNCPAYAIGREAIPPEKRPHLLPPIPPDTHLGSRSRDPAAQQKYEQQQHGLPQQHAPHEQQGQHEDEPMFEEHQQDSYDETTVQEAPVSPPYYGPEPTPPRDPTQPLDPDTHWLPHDPSAYPFHILPPPGPPPMDADQPQDHQHNQHGQYDDQQHDAYYGLAQLAEQEGGYGGGTAAPAAPPAGAVEPDVNPYYVDDAEYDRRHGTAGTTGAGTEAATPAANGHPGPGNATGNGSIAAGAADGGGGGAGAETGGEKRAAEATATDSPVKQTKKRARQKSTAPVNYENDDFEDL